MISKTDRKTLIQYRVEQAKSTAKEADYLRNNQMYRGAMNRVYYSMFYMLQALALKYEYETSKHQRLIGWFNKEFVHTGILEKKYSKIITKGYNYRTKGDYETTFEFEESIVNEMFSAMNDFILKLEKFIQQS